MKTRTKSEDGLGPAPWKIVIVGMFLLGGVSCGGDSTSSSPGSTSSPGPPSALVNSPGQANFAVGSSSGGGYVLRAMPSSSSVTGSPMGSGVKLDVSPGGAP